MSRRIGAVGIVSSTGGPGTLLRMLDDVAGSMLGPPILIVQHTVPGHAGALAGWLSDSLARPVSIAVDGEPLSRGAVRVAPDGLHMVVSELRIRLHEGPPVRGHRPSGTRLLESIARELGPRGVGIVLTGMGDDGAAGLAALEQAGGAVLVEDPARALVRGMPQAALAATRRALVLDAPGIGGWMERHWRVTR